MTPETRHKAIAAAWTAWKARNGGKLGPGPAFTEAIDAALAVILKEFKPPVYVVERGVNLESLRIAGEKPSQIVVLEDATIEAERTVARWQRFNEVEGAWYEVHEDDLPHYRKMKQRIRPLYAGEEEQP